MSFEQLNETNPSFDNVPRSPVKSTQYDSSLTSDRYTQHHTPPHLYNDTHLNASKSFKLCRPYEALFSRHGGFNWIMGLALCFFINIAAMYGAVFPKDYVGVWHTPFTPNPYSLPLWADYLTIVMATWAGIGLLSVPGNWASMKFATKAPPAIMKTMGVCNPVDQRYVYGGDGIQPHWLLKASGISYLPRGNKHILTRLFICIFFYAGIFYGITLLIVYGMCKSGHAFAAGPDGYGSVDPYCYILPEPYIWIKAVWATLFMAIIYPVGYISGQTECNVPDWGLQGWYDAKQHFEGMEADAKHSPA